MIRKRLFMALAILLLTLSVQASDWYPSYTYAKFLPAFKIDNVWKFTSNLSKDAKSEDGGALQGCSYTAIPGAIAWCTISWRHRTSHTYDHDLQWLELYIVNVDNPRQDILLCKIYPAAYYGETDKPDNWWLDHVDDYNGNVTRLANECYRDKVEGGSAYYYFVTFYSDEVRALIERNPDHVVVRVKARWDRDESNYVTLDNETAVAEGDRVLQSYPTAPNPQNVAWTVYNNQTCVSYNHNLDTKNSRKLYVNDGSKDTLLTLIQGSPAYYHPAKLSNYAASLKTRDILHLKTYCTQSFSFDKTRYNSSCGGSCSFGSISSSTVKSSSVSLVPPTFAQPYNASVVDHQDGINTVLWYCDPPTTTDTYDASGFVVERSTSPGFTQDYQIYQNPPVAYNTALARYELTDVHPVRDQGVQTFYYRISRQHAKNTELNTMASIESNTNYASLENFEAYIDSAANKVNLRWAYNPGLRNDELTLNIRYGTTNRIFPVDSTEWKGIVLPGCQETEFQAQLYVNGLDYRAPKTATVTLPRSNPGIIDTMMVSAGFYNDHVNVKWRVNQEYPFFSSFVITRTEYNSNHPIEETLTTVSFNAGVYDYTYVDYSCIPGVYYVYKIKGLDMCDQTLMTMSEKTAIGFAQPYGVVSGQITYDGNQAVPGVKVVAECESQYGGKSLSLIASRKPTIEMPVSIVNQIAASPTGTIEFFLKIDDTRSRFPLMHFGDMMSLECENNSLFLSVGTTQNVEIPNALVPGVFTHVAMAFSTEGNQRTVVLYKNGDSIASITATLVSQTGEFNDVLMFGSDGESRYMTGNLDEIRIWNTQRTHTEIELYRTNYLNGTEQGLVAYYRCDDNVSRMLFDISKTGSNYNSRHIPMSNVVIDDMNIPTAEQLGLKAYTDANGNYLFNNIPYSEQGSLYNIVPTLGVHEFTPSLTPIFFNNSASTHNRIDFSDISSFPVSGKVTYYNTNYPVAGCMFLLDGTTLCIGEDGEPVVSDENGEYEIYVPIGKHSITISKGSHVFANNGRYPADPYNTGTKFDFQHEITNLTFQDSTFMLVTGRVSGGADEAEKAHGFGLGKAVIGQAEIVLGTPGDLYNLNLDEDSARVFTMPQDSIYGTCNSVAYTEPAYQNAAHYITILTDSITGEFNVMLPPLDYEVRSIDLVNNNDYISFDLSSIGNINLSEKETIQLTTDSATLDSINYRYFNYSAALDAIHYSTPKMTVRQNTANLALGASHYVYLDAVAGVTDTVSLFEIGENGEVTYRFGHPCFSSDETCTWNISVNETYVNYDKQDPDTTLQPLRYGVVTVSNDFGAQLKNDVALTDTTLFYSSTAAVSVSGDELLLDENGTTYYSFLVGEPNILAPYTSYFSIYYQDPARTRRYEWGGNAENEAIVLGSKVIGNSFETQGPDEIFYILRDPVGSESYAEWEKGETITREKTSSWSIPRSEELSYGWLFGPAEEYSVETKARSLQLSSGEAVSNAASSSIQFFENYEGETTMTSSQTWEFTNAETVTTSADPTMVGAKADIYIGVGTNRLFGDAEQVYVKRDTSGNYSIDVKSVISVESEFTTQFNYSQMYIEENLIPDMEMHRNQLLTQVTASQYDTSFVNNTNAPVYITTLSPTDPNYSKQGTYLRIIPQSWKTDPTRLGIDEVYNYNIQIQRWIDAMAHNERCKVMVHNSTKPFDRKAWEETVYGETDKNNPFDSVYAPSVDAAYSLLDTLAAKYKGGWLDQNYSLAGASLSVNETREYSTMGNGFAETDGFMIDVSGTQTFQILLFGSNLNYDVSGGAHWDSESGTTNSESSSVSYNIELGFYDALTFDVYQSPDGFGPIFAALGGQTSCPHQDAEYTKYYEPGTEIQAATIPVAEPRITVQNPVVSNVPVEESAFFNIQVANASTVTNALSSFVLAQEVGSNPDGALILLNGHELSQDGTGFNMYGGDVINKTIEIAQTRYDVLDYDSIALVFYTDCYMYDADTVYLSAHFVETCADISLSTDYNILNNTTDETVEFTIEDFNQQFRNLNGVELQYKRMGDTEWHLLKDFPADSAAVINYEFTFTKPTFPDGTYLFRAVTRCQFGNEFVTNESLPVAVLVDMAEPEPLGEPYPIDGFYTANSQIYVEFNEPIQTGRVLSDNVLVEGVLNAHDVDHSISLLLDHTTAMTNATYNLGATPFTLEMWVNYSEPGTLFSYANGANSGIEFGIDSTGHLTAKVNGTEYTSTGTMVPETWGYLVIQCDAVNGLLSASYSHDNLNVTLFNPIQIGQAAASGNLRFGGNNLVAKIHEVSLWKQLRTTADALAERSESKNSYTQGLLSLWHMEEGEGFTAVDAVRQRNLKLTDDSWAYNHVNYAMHVAAGDTAVINLARSPLNTDKNFVIEFWFRATGDATLCSFPEHGYEMSIVNSSLVIDGYTMPISNYLDDTWHHLALIKPKNAMPVVAIDGKQLASARITALPTFTVSKVSFGSTSNTNDVNIDEFRLWKVNSTLDAVRLLSGTCLDGDEDGLVAYYPMEEYVTDAITSQTSTEFSLFDRTDEDHTRTIDHTNTANAQAASAPALVESRPTEYVAHTYTTSSNKIMVNITEDAYRIEGCELEITVKDIVDENGNYSEPIRWTVFVNRNQLLWDNDSYEIEKDQDADTTIELTIVNNSSMVQNWEISGVPSCMTLSETSGVINPLQTLTIECTIDATADLGENEYELALSGDEGLESYLYITTEVYANEPDWEINPRLYENSMNIVAYAEINGWVADDEQDMVAAFVDGELAGVANLELLPAMGRYYIMMTIYQNDTVTSAPRRVTFKYWDASTGKVYDNSQAYQTLNDTTYNPITITYSDNLTLGSIVRPIRIVMGDEIEQSIQLHRGWNWISYNVVPTSLSFSSILRPYLTDFDIIKSQTGFGVSDSVSALVRGSIGTMDCSKGYRLKAIMPFEMTLSGYATPLTPISLTAQRWTWFGFQPQRALTVNAALSNINPTVGDIVKSQTQFATWDGYQWVGSLNVLIPGQSYIYNNTGNNDINFTYPEYSADAAYQLPMKDAAIASYFDPIEPGKYQGNMSITAVVKYEGEEVTTAEVGIFAGSECRASAVYDDGYYFVTVPGDSTVVLTVKVLYNDSVYTMEETIGYQNDAVVGTLAAPYVIDLNPEATSVVTATADNEGDKVEKIMIDNEVFIIRNGKMYDIYGRPRNLNNQK